MLAGPIVTVRPCVSLTVALKVGEVFNCALVGVHENVATLSKVMPAGMVTGVIVTVSPAGALVCTTYVYSEPTFAFVTGWATTNRPIVIGELVAAPLSTLLAANG